MRTGGRRWSRKVVSDEWTAFTTIVVSESAPKRRVGGPGEASERSGRAGIGRRDCGLRWLLKELSWPERHEPAGRRGRRK